MTSYNQLKQYFAHIVEQSQDINDYTGYFARELHSKQGSYDGVTYPCLSLFGYSIGIEGEELNSVAVRSMNFGILIGNVPADDYEAQYQAIDQAETIAWKVIARLRYDHNDKTHFLYNALLKNSIEVRPIELEGVGLFGVEVAFKLKNRQSLKLEPNDWKDVEKIC